MVVCEEVPNEVSEELAPKRSGVQWNCGDAAAESAIATLSAVRQVASPLAVAPAECLMATESAEHDFHSPVLGHSDVLGPVLGHRLCEKPALGAEDSSRGDVAPE